MDGSQFCDECGTNLQSSGHNHNEFQVQSYQPPLSEPSFQAASVTSIGIEPIVEHIEPTPAGQNVEKKVDGAHSNLIIERGTSVGRQFLLTADESLIGRWDADNGIFPDVDLDAHDPEAKVSRRHARIVHQNGRFSIEDLGSTNGTYINRGRRLIPGSPNLLNDGDEIIVGKTFLRFKVNK
ncbi:MAG: FHA domain-containing protein [Acidobacteria bacterium]|nr:FHA domain-containing protein [Acidobacteriota bacterium]